jgi:hypothetical protein
MKVVNNLRCANVVQVSPDQLIQAQGPLVMFNKLHEKFCLVVGQGQILGIANEYPLFADEILQLTLFSQLLMRAQDRQLYKSRGI